MKPLLKYVLLLCVLWHTAVKAQPYQLNEIVHNDVALDTVLNYPKSKTKLSAFMSKPLVIVYWHYTCGTCMGMFRWMDSLTERHKKSVNFLLITSASAAKVKSLMKENKHIGKMKIPFVVADKRVSELFPHYSVPHVVWIGNKKVQAITGHKELDDANLLALSSGEPIDLPLKEEATDKREFHSIDPIILYNFEQHRKGIRKYSLLSERRQNIASGTTVYYKDSFTRVNKNNTSVFQLYRTAYSQGTKHRSLVDFKKNKQYEPNNLTGEHLYCYDLLVKTGSLKEGLRYMQDELDQYFYLRSRLERREVDCYLLQRIDSTAQGKNTWHDEHFDMPMRKITTIHYLVEVLNKVLDKPIVNETGMTRDIQMYLPKQPKDVIFYKQYLLSQGFLVAEGKREQIVLVID